MEPHVKELEQLFKNAQKILVTSHISPDPDAISSVLLAGTTLQANFPEKDIQMVLEEKPTRDLSFLTGYTDIKFQSTADAVKQIRPELMLVVDAMNYERISRADAEEIRLVVKDLGTKVAVIDHHEAIDVEPSALYFNKKNPATAQELYEVLFDEMGLRKPEGYAQTALLGIITDTARHKYDNPRHRQTFKLVSDLIDAGASIEKLENKIDRYDKNQLQAFSEMAKNIKDSGEGFTYTYMDESIFSDRTDQPSKAESMKSAAEIFTSQFARNFENNNWGFVVYPELASGPDVYAVSFRSISGGVNVADLAHKLGGGGHKQAAAAKIKATSIDEAVERVREVIKEAI